MAALCAASASAIFFSSAFSFASMASRTARASAAASFACCSALATSASILAAASALSLSTLACASDLAEALAARASSASFLRSSFFWISRCSSAFASDSCFWQSCRCFILSFTSSMASPTAPLTSSPLLSSPALPASLSTSLCAESASAAAFFASSFAFLPASCAACSSCSRSSRWCLSSCSRRYASFTTFCWPRSFVLSESYSVWACHSPLSLFSSFT
mmetsp:Transcript_20221/g.63349  ORF Transcript_20221/g.63349 Transcript_20221/m.63349 type:complete len:219 (-) Transcript_20221:397-1053(-)